MSASYKINEEALSHELIDGEVVIIQFDSGNYYSLSGSAALIWQCFVSPASLADLPSLFSAPPSGASDELAAFVGELVQEGLLSTAEASTPVAPASPVPYSKPVLNKYTDMQQLLLADPLHEVQETGWPHTKRPEA
ncbi:MAG: PqqD family peptide modification chaperone [Opitutaceae bacterium]|nr:PqqD family peptide modification chaperone [Opitutaceae bacterium]